MKRRSMLFAAALAAMSLFGSAAHAGGILVTSESGSLGSFTLTNTGISGGVSTLVLSLLSPGSESLQTINGSSVSIPAAYVSPITLEVTPAGGGVYTIALTPPNYTKTFGTGAASAELTYNIDAGQTFGSAFFNLTGLVTSVVMDALPGYSFAPFLGGAGINNVALTATSFSGGASSFDSVVTTVGGSATGSGSFSEIASVPEPGTFALLGIGISGLLTFRRFFKKNSVT